MKSIALALIMVVALSLHGCSQSASKKQNAGSLVVVGGECEGCEAVHESPIPFDKLPSSLTLPDFKDPGPKIEISGTIYQRDGRTPAPGVVLYVYHTDQAGNYATRGGETGWGKRHGYNRGWLKTDDKGFYQVFTLVPASCPNSNNPKHIHPIIKEPGKTEYWIDEFLFADDPLLKPAEKNPTDPRGGSGVLTPVKKDGMLRATRNIVLGLNIPGYPVANAKESLQQSTAAGSGFPDLSPFFYPRIVRESIYLSEAATKYPEERWTGERNGACSK